MITKLPDGRYAVRVRVGGKRPQLTFPTRKQALACERKWADEQLARRAGLPYQRDPVTFGELCDGYLATHQVSPRTIATIRERLKYSRAAFGSTLVRDLRPEEIARWNAQLRSKPTPGKKSSITRPTVLSPTTRAGALRAMRQVLAAGVRWDYLLRNPAGPGAVNMPPVPPKDIRPFESWGEVDAVAAKAGRYAALITFACATGLRPQEWMALQWRDVDLPKRQLRISRTVQNGKVAPGGKTDGSLRTVSLQRRAVDALQSLPRPIDGSTLIFQSPEGGLINLSNFRRRIWNGAVKDAGLQHRPLCETRHTYATLSLSAGVPMDWIAEALGHSDTRTTRKHYARFLPAADHRALALLDAFEAAPGREEDAADAG